MKHGMRMGQRNAGGGKEGLQPLLDPTTRPASFTSHVPAPILFHTTGPARFAAHVLQSGFAHTTCPGSRFRFKPHVLQGCMPHTTGSASFTPHVLQGQHREAESVLDILSHRKVSRATVHYTTICQHPLTVP